MKKLKEIDKKLLNLIQEEEMAVPRITKIARALGIPVTTVKTKLDKFKKIGVIKGYSAIIDPDKVDRGFVAFKFGGKKFKKMEDLDVYGKKLAAIPEVEEVFFLVGEWDYVCKMRLKDKDEYTKVAPKIALLLDGCKGVISPKTFKDSHKVLVK